MALRGGFQVLEEGEWLEAPLCINDGGREFVRKIGCTVLVPPTVTKQHSIKSSKINPEPISKSLAVQHLCIVVLRACSEWILPGTNSNTRTPEETTCRYKYCTGKTLLVPR